MAGKVPDLKRTKRFYDLPPFEGGAAKPRQTTPETEYRKGLSTIKEVDGEYVVPHNTPVTSPREEKG